MTHRKKKKNKLGRKKQHRLSMLSNMACSLIKYNRIITTLAKAKSLRKYIEPLLTRGKVYNLHNIRILMKHLKNRDYVKYLYNEISPKIKNRNGGYIRIIKIGYRKGDNAKKAFVTFVDKINPYEN